MRRLVIKSKLKMLGVANFLKNGKQCLAKLIKRKRRKQMNGKTVVAAVAATLVVLVIIKKAGNKIPAGVRNWLP